MKFQWLCDDLCDKMQLKSVCWNGKHFVKNTRIIFELFLSSSVSSIRPVVAMVANQWITPNTPWSRSRRFDGKYVTRVFTAGVWHCVIRYWTRNVTYITQCTCTRQVMGSQHGMLPSNTRGVLMYDQCSAIGQSTPTPNTIQINIQVCIFTEQRSKYWPTVTWSPLVQTMACCITASSHYLNQCWLIVNDNIVDEYNRMKFRLICKGSQS